MNQNEQQIRSEVDAAGARLRPHKTSWLMGAYGQMARLFGVSDFTSRFWLTLCPVIYHPNQIAEPLSDVSLHVVIRHELVHIKQQRGRLSAWVFKYLLSQAFRWEAEREAFLVNIRDGSDPESIAVTLHRDYKISKPSVHDMVKWFEAHR